MYCTCTHIVVAFKCTWCTYVHTCMYVNLHVYKCVFVCTCVHVLLTSRLSGDGSVNMMTWRGVLLCLSTIRPLEGKSKFLHTTCNSFIISEGERERKRNEERRNIHKFRHHVHIHAHLHALAIVNITSLTCFQNKFGCYVYGTHRIGKGARKVLHSRPPLNEYHN